MKVDRWRGNEQAMETHVSNWITLLVGIGLVAVAVATGNDWAAVIGGIWIAGSLIGLAYARAGPVDPSTSVIHRWRNGRARR